MNINVYDGLTILDFRIWLKCMINMEFITHKVLHQIDGLLFFLHHYIYSKISFNLFVNSLLENFQV